MEICKASLGTKLYLPKTSDDPNSDNETFQMLGWKNVSKFKNGICLLNCVTTLFVDLLMT